MPRTIDIRQFLNLCEEIPVADVRSPAEFCQGHIPGAVNIPLFNDLERATIGTLYKNEGNYRAILEGLDIAGPKMSAFVKEAKNRAVNNQLIVHCWRGGMRSASMAWLFETAAIDCQILEGGYKSYRSSFRNFIKQPFKFIILGGLTGSGKSEILREIEHKGRQVIDLEKLANHKGSAFGWLGQGEQPTNEQFQNNLYRQLLKFDLSKPIWIEDESKTIGNIYLPDDFYNQMKGARVIQIEVPKEERIKRLVEEYSIYSKDELLFSLDKIKKKFGNQNIVPATNAILERNYEEAAKIILQYYDRTYLFGLSKRNDLEISKLSFETIDPAKNAEIILNFSNLHYSQNN